MLDEPSSFCLIIRQHGVQAAQLAGRKLIAKLVENDLDAIKAKSLAMVQGGALYTAILQPIANTIEGANLIVIPDGDLNSVPFAALIDTQGRHLIRTRSLDYAPSGTVLALLRGGPGERQKQLPAVGNVAYGQEPRLVRSASFFRGLESLTRKALHPLPATQDEVR